MRQERSWVQAEGVREHPALVGQVFFPLDSHRLDREDQRLLGELARRYQILLLGRRIELTFTGHADQRGRRDYNRRLGLRRARAVKGYMDGILGGGRFRLYSSQEALSRGELDAVQGRASAAQMAADRRVDIFSSYIPARRVRLPPLLIEAPRPVRRLSHREFRSSKGQDMYDLGRPDPLGDAIDNLIKYWATRGESVYGSEVRSSRRTTTVPVVYRVNIVRIRTESSSQVSVLATAEASNTYVTYEWGPPADTVRVIWTRRSRQLNTGQVSETSSTRSFPRADVAGNSVFFPPDPE